jgi:hypothetical protein
LSLIWINSSLAALLPVLACYGDRNRYSPSFHTVAPYDFACQGYINLDRYRQDAPTFKHFFHASIDAGKAPSFKQSFFIMGFAKFIPLLLLAAKNALADTPIAVSDFTDNGGLAAA